MGWNYRVFRCAEKDGTHYYEIREAYYDDSHVNGWSASGASPMGETLSELVNDFSWMLAALARPVLDEETGKECEPAHMLADDLRQWVETRTEAPTK